MSELHLYMLGAISKPTPNVEVWVTSPAAVVAAKREYAAQHGLRETQVWAERRKGPGGFITRLADPRTDAFAEADVQVDRIMRMSDDEIIAEVRANGEDPTQIAAHMRDLLNRVLEGNKN